MGSNTGVTDVMALATIKELEEFKLVERTPLDPKQCGYPILLGDPTKNLNSMIGEEIGRLTALMEKIKTLKIDQKIIATCIELLERKITALKEPTLVLDRRDLPDAVPTNHSNHDAVEEIEIEIQAAREVEKEVEQAVSLELEMELTLEAEVRTEVETYKPREHPFAMEGREWIDYALGGWGWWQSPFSDHPENRGNGYIDPKAFPDIFVSNHALGIYRGAILANDLSRRPERQALLWLYGEPENESSLSSKAMIGISPKGEMFCQLGSVKDGDFYFYNPLKEKKIATEWVYVSFEQAKKMDHTQFCPYQRETIEAAKNPTYGEKYYNDKAKWYAEMKETRFFKIDLHETKIPPSLPASHRQKWVEMTTLAKILYMDAPFSPEERTYLNQWLEHSPVPLPVLEKRLKSYLNRFYPGTKNNSLLTLLQQKIKG